MATTPSTTVVIIGAGASGTLVAANLLRQASNPLHIVLAERTGEFGRGVAFGTDNLHHLLNVPAGRMSGWVDQPDDFVRWLQTNAASSLDGKPDPQRMFAPRPLYRNYLLDLLASAESHARAGVTLERIPAEAIAIERVGDGFVVRFDRGRAVAASRVVLTSGYSPPRDLTIADATFFQSDRYIPDAWAAGRIAAIATEDPILLLGAGLTMVDVAIALHDNGHRGPIHSVSRHGIYPLSHGPSAVHNGLLPVDESTITARLLMHRLRDEVRAANAASGQDWRGVTDAQRPITTRLWQNLPEVEKQRFLRHAMPYWEVHRHRIAPDVGASLERLRQAGRLTVRAGLVQRLLEIPDGVEVTFRPRGGGPSATFQVGAVVNCTGASLDYRSERPLAIDSLIKRGLARPNALGLGLNTAADGALLDERDQPTLGLYTVGVFRKGDLWESTAIPELRAQAAALGTLLLRSFEAST